MRPTQNRSLKKAVLFCVIVLVLLLLSLLFRIFLSWKDSTYDGNSRYTLAIIQDKTHATVLSFDPDEGEIITLLLSGTSADTPESTLGIPVDGKVILHKDVKLYENNPARNLLTLLLRPTQMKKNMTEIDIFRLYLFAQTVSSNHNRVEKVSLSTKTRTPDKIMHELFIDTHIIDENKSIEIVNGTGVSGLGKRLETMIRNSGGNVVAVSNAHVAEEHSRIHYYQKPSYTLDKLSKRLRYPVEPITERGIADIKIIIGTDSIQTTYF